MYISLVVGDVSMSYHNVSLCHTTKPVQLCHNVMTISHIT